jgi:hypothetical protein
LELVPRDVSCPKLSNFCPNSRYIARCATFEIGAPPASARLCRNGGCQVMSNFWMSKMAKLLSVFFEVSRRFFDIKMLPFDIKYAAILMSNDVY